MAASGALLQDRRAAPQLGSLVEVLKATLDEGDKSSRQLQARVLRGLEAVDERMVLRQRDSHHNVTAELASLFQKHASTLEAAAAQRNSDLAGQQARAHAEMLAALEMTARQAAEADAAAQAESRAGQTATRTILEGSLGGVAGAIQQLADSVQQLRTEIRRTQGQTEAMRAEIHQVAGRTQGLKEGLEQSAAHTEARFITHAESLEQRLVQALVELRAASREDYRNSRLELENRIHLGITEPLKGIVQLMHTQLSEIQTTAQKTLDALRSIDAIARLERSGTPADQRSQKNSNIVELSSHSQSEAYPPER